MQLSESASNSLKDLRIEFEQVLKTLTLSQLPAANNVFSQFTAISEISALCPRNVASNLPSELDQIFTKLSSAPCTGR